MNHDTLIVDIRRRRILKTIGMISGAAMAAPMIPGASGKAIAGTAASILSGRRAIRVGMLLPGSTMQGSHATRLRNGLELALATKDGRAGGRRIELVTEETGPTLGAAVRTARSLALDHNADIVVGMVSPNVTRQIGDMFEERGAIFIEAGAGERMTRPSERRPHIFHSSLGGWESMMAMGAWAARNIGRGGAVAGSFYDSGYDMLNAFRCGFEGAGGRIVTQQITGTPRNEITIANAVKTIADIRPDFILGLYSGGAALAFLDASHRMGSLDGIPMLCSGLMVDESLPRLHGDLMAGLRSAHTWAGTIASDANRAFVEAYGAKRGERPDATAVLGYETGMMITRAIDEAAGDTGAIARALEGMSIESPRGRVTIDPATHTTMAPNYLREVTAGAGNRIVGELRPDPVGSRAMHDIATGSRSGWVHSHLWG